MITYNLRRVLFLYRQLSLGEFVTALYKQFIRKTLREDDHSLFTALVVLIHSADRSAVARKMGDRNQLQFREHGQDRRLVLRRGTSDYFIFNQIFIRRDYNALLDLVSQHFGDRPVQYMMDAGANIGCATVLFKTWFPEARIIAIEPESSNHALAAQNVALNGLTGVHLEQGGLWIKDEQLCVRSDFRDGSHSAFTVSSAKDGQPGAVAGFTVASLLRKHRFPRLDVLKIDIEGAEKYLFSDDAHLQSFLPLVHCVAVEVHEECITEAEVTNKLEQFGFTCSKSGEYLIGFNQHLNA
jgi:FkbM family methyltransferase